MLVLAFGGALLAACEPGGAGPPAAQAGAVVAAEKAEPDWTELDKALENKTDALRLRRARSTNFRNGIMIPLGVSLEDFKALTLMDCSGPPEETVCDVADAIPLDCPSEEGCGQVSYWFGRSGLEGFSALYGEHDWRAMMERTVGLYGPGTHRRSQVGPMSSEQWVWNFDAGVLTFVHYSGTDLSGNPVGRPFVIIFSRQAAASK